ncbi:hypothetical protein [Kocuria sabuli]|uniref:hypothetical protein n=1 Tax=Kocuria sabuli TaxID=3071448 RepID=UPI0034D75535
MEERLPGLTAAEADLLEHYARILELLARMNPARPASTVHGCPNTSQALISEARALHAALATMQARGQDQFFHRVHTQVLRHLGIEAHLRRLELPD